MWLYNECTRGWSGRERTESPLPQPPFLTKIQTLESLNYGFGLLPFPLSCNYFFTQLTLINLPQACKLGKWEQGFIHASHAFPEPSQPQPLSCRSKESLKPVSTDLCTQMKHTVKENTRRHYLNYTNFKNRLVSYWIVSTGYYHTGSTDSLVWVMRFSWTAVN